MSSKESGYMPRLIFSCSLIIFANFLFAVNDDCKIGSFQKIRPVILCDPQFYKKMEDRAKNPGFILNTASFPFIRDCIGQNEVSICYMQRSRCYVLNPVKTQNDSDYDDSKRTSETEDDFSRKYYDVNFDLGEMAWKPLLFYYVVDTSEPLMKDAIFNEVNSLKKICTKEYKHFNWIVFVNSNYTKATSKAPSFIYCKNGELNIQKFDNP